jgi:bacteriorhodopsin
MAAVIANYGPRIVIPGFFVGTSVIKMPSIAEAFKITAFSLLFVTAVETIFRGPVHWLGLIPGIACVAYWQMMYDKDKTELYRYADWALTTPLMLIAIFSAGGLVWPLIVFLVLFDLEMILAGYLGTQDPTQQKQYFALGMAAFAPIVYFLLQQKKNAYIVALTIFIWSLYPLIYYLRESKTFTEEISVSAYALMDIISKIALVSFLKF